MNLEQLTDSTENLALEIPPLVYENLEGGAPETRELIDRRRKGMHSTHSVNWSTITRTNSLPRAVRDKSPRTSRCTLSMGGHAWYKSMTLKLSYVKDDNENLLKCTT